MRCGKSLPRIDWLWVETHIGYNAKAKDNANFRGRGGVGLGAEEGVGRIWPYTINQYVLKQKCGKGALRAWHAFGSRRNPKTKIKTRLHFRDAHVALVDSRPTPKQGNGNATAARVICDDVHRAANLDPRLAGAGDRKGQVGAA